MTATKLEPNVEFDEEKFKELMLYIADRSFDDRSFGSVKLDKILFFSDFIAFQNRGKSITGATYIHKPLGPVPSQLLKSREALIDEGRAQLWRREDPLTKQKQDRLQPLKGVDVSAFDSVEIDIVDRVIEILKDAMAGDVSELSHTLAGWQIAEDGETIPYTSVFLSLAPPSSFMIQRARELARDDGQLADSA